MEKVLIDTDIIIDFLRGHTKRIKDLFVKIENKIIVPYLTHINIAELYSGEDVNQPKKEKALSELLSYFKIADLTVEIAKFSGRLRNKYQLSLADSLIASVSIAESLKIATFNTKHFQKIPEIRFYTF